MDFVKNLSNNIQALMDTSYMQLKECIDHLTIVQSFLTSAIKVNNTDKEGLRIALDQLEVILQRAVALDRLRNSIYVFIASHSLSSLRIGENSDPFEPAVKLVALVTELSAIVDTHHTKVITSQFEEMLTGNYDLYIVSKTNKVSKGITDYIEQYKPKR